MNRIECYLVGLEREDFSVEPHGPNLSRNMRVEQIEQIAANPTTLTSDQKGKSLLFALHWASELGDEVPRSYFVHNLLWQLFHDEAREWFTEFDAELRQEIWEHVEAVYVELGKLGDDPEWVRNRQNIRSRILGT